MRHYTEKVKHILPTILLVLIGSTISLGVTRAYLYTYFRDEIWELGLPFILPILPIWIWLYPKTGALKFRRSDGRTSLLLLIFVWIFVVNINSQIYLTVALGKLAVVENITAIKSTDRFVKIKNIYTDHMYMSFYHTYYSTGRYGKTYPDFWFVLPALKTYTDTVSNNHLVWFGLKFNAKGVKGVSEGNYEKLCDMYASQVRIYNFTAADYFQKVCNSLNIEGFLCATKQSQNKDIAFFMPVKGKFEERTQGKILPILGSFLLGLLIFLVWLIRIDLIKRTMIGKHIIQR